MEEPFEQPSPRRLRRLARRGARARRRSAEKFLRLAERHGTNPRQLRILADAWVVAGRDGVSALGPAPAALDQDDEAALEAAGSQIEEWRRRHHPLEALELDVWRNRITVWRLAPGEDPRHDRVARRPLMQLRLDGRRRWHLYRKAAQGEWWPVAVSSAGPDRLGECLEVVRLDVAQEFWGDAVRPYESPELPREDTGDRE